MAKIENEIIKLIHEINPFEEIQADTELIKSGILTSMALFELIYLLENEFDIEIPEEQFVPENFSSVAIMMKSVEELIDKKII
jgi:acyl carrier protein